MFRSDNSCLSEYLLYCSLYFAALRRLNKQINVLRGNIQNSKWLWQQNSTTQQDVNKAASGWCLGIICYGTGRKNTEETHRKRTGDVCYVVYKYTRTLLKLKNDLEYLFTACDKPENILFPQTLKNQIKNAYEQYENELNTFVEDFQGYRTRESKTEVHS